VLKSHTNTTLDVNATSELEMSARQRFILAGLMIQEDSIKLLKRIL